MSTYRQDSRNIYQVGDWLRYGWLDHGFGTRHSDGWVDAPVATLKQIHSDTVVRVNDERGCLGQGDALITNRPGVHLTIRTADCMPILIVDPVHRAVAAVHAGWRGTASSIAAKAVARLQSEFGSAAAELQAAIGPGIGGCCYEVGPDVAAQFALWCPEFDGITEPVCVDLLEVNRRQLAAAGVGRIIDASRCTRCDSDEFHSFRRDRDLSGRMVSAIAISADVA